MAERRQNSRRGMGAKHPGKNRRKESERRGSERRENTRVSLELWMEEQVGDDVYFRRTGNLSAGGVYFDSAIPHQLGTEMTLKFTLPGCREMVVARAKVVSHSEKASDGLGMGVKFISFEGNGKDKLKGYMLAL